MKNKKYDIVGPFTKFGRKIVERGKIDNKHIYDCLLYDLSTGT
jgi:hypothetical protein